MDNVQERELTPTCDTAHWGPCWYLDDLASSIFQGGSTIKEARVVGAPLRIA